MKKNLEEVMCSDEYAQAMEAAQLLLEVEPRVEKLLGILEECKTDECYEHLWQRINKLQGRINNFTAVCNGLENAKNEIKEYTKQVTEENNKLARERRFLVQNIVHEAQQELESAKKDFQVEFDRIVKRYQETKAAVSATVRTQMTNEVVSVIQGLKSEGVEITDSVVASVMSACSYSNWSANRADNKWQR